MRSLRALAEGFRPGAGARHSGSCATARRCTRTFIGPGRYDWSFADETFAELQRRNIIPIVDLCHFGVPDWIGNFQNPDFPELFAGYAEAFARRFPWVQLYTPINEMFVCAAFSASMAGGTSSCTTDRAFVTALKHIVKANVLAMHAILEVRPDAIFIQSESSGILSRGESGGDQTAEIMNARRFLSLDLNYGRRVDSEMYEFLMDNGMTRDEYHFFLAAPPEASLHHGERLLYHQRASRHADGSDACRQVRYSAMTRSRGNITTATGCR